MSLLRLNIKTLLTCVLTLHYETVMSMVDCCPIVLAYSKESGTGVSHAICRCMLYSFSVHTDTLAVMLTNSKFLTFFRKDHSSKNGT